MKLDKEEKEIIKNAVENSYLAPDTIEKIEGDLGRLSPEEHQNVIDALKDHVGEVKKVRGMRDQQVKAIAAEEKYIAKVEALIEGLREP
jgi:hypothetical protein